MLHLLFAEQSPFQSISRYMNRSGSRVEVGFFAGLICAIGCLFLCFFLVDRFLKSRLQRRQTVTVLFHELCQAHRLGRRDRQLLQHAAASVVPQNQCQIFTDPRILSSLAQQRSQDMAGYARLLKVIFE